MSTGEAPSELVSRAFNRRTASLGRVRFDDHKPSISEAILTSVAQTFLLTQHQDSATDL